MTKENDKKIVANVRSKDEIKKIIGKDILNDRV